MDNVLDEIRTRTASAACDRRTNSIVESLVFSANLKQLLEVFGRCAPYAVFLAYNRHSSHVLQAMFARLCFLVKGNVLGDLEEEYIQQSVLTFCQPLLAGFNSIMKETAGSHVLRSAMCALAGVPVVAERKGKDSKHQHSVSLSESLEALTSPQRLFICETAAFMVPHEFHAAFIGAVETLLSSNQSTDLHDMVADPTACAVLGLLLRVLSNPAIIAGGPALAERLVKQTLNWDRGSSDDASYGSNMFYAMAGDRSGSYFLQAVVECCAEGVFLEIVGKTVVERAVEYAKDAFGNFVLQSALKRLCKELERKDGLLVKKTDRLARALLAELAAPDSFEHLMLKKGGVVLWMLDLCRYVKLKEELGWPSQICDLVHAVWTNESAINLTTVMVTKLGKKERDDGNNNGNRPGENAGALRSADKDSAQVLFCKVVGAVLRLETSVSDKTITAISHLPEPVVASLAQSGQLSRAVLDPFFEHGCRVGPKPLQRLVESLLPSLKEVGAHFVGQHVVKRAFDGADSKTKEKMAAEASNLREQLARSSFGRNTLKNLQAELYGRAPEEWRALVARQQRAMGMLKELDDITATKPFFALAASAASVASAAPAAPVQAEGAKRKRKRARKEKTHLKFGDDDDDEGYEGGAGEEPAKAAKAEPAKAAKEEPAKAVQRVTRETADFKKISALKGKVSMKNITDMLEGKRR